MELAASFAVPTVSGHLGHANGAAALYVYAHFLEAGDRRGCGRDRRAVRPADLNVASLDS
jgi:hypothetical protein